MKVVKTGGLSFESLEVRELLEAGPPRCGLAHFPPGCALPEAGTTRHDLDEFTFILEGNLRVESSGEVREIGPGDLIYIPGGEEHRSATLGGTPCRLVWFLAGRREGT